MSYQIIFRNIVTKSPNGIIYPILEIGASNVRDDLGIIARGWYIVPWLSFSKEELTQKFKDMIKDHFDDNDLTEENWLLADSEYWLWICQEWTTWTINSLINMLTTPKQDFNHLKHFSCAVELENFQTKYCSLKELDEEIAKGDGKINNYVRLRNDDIDDYFMLHKE